jgi:hypothetical protein
MKTAPQLQEFILQLAEKHGMVIHQPGAYLRLDLDGDSLVLEHLGASRIAIAHQLYLFHEWVVDPEIVLWTDYAAGWAPIEVNQVQGGWHSYAELDANGDLVDFTDVEDQAALASFAEEVVVPNLTTRGWLERGIPSNAPQPVYTLEQRQERGYLLMDLLPVGSLDAHGSRMAGCQSANHDHCYGELWQCAACGKTVCYAEGSDDHPEWCDDCWCKHYAVQEEADDVPF